MKTWATLLDEAEARGGKFTSHGKERAEDWTRCAVGEHMGDLGDDFYSVYGGRPVYTHPAPSLDWDDATGFSVDATTNDESAITALGINFATAVASNNVPRAREVYAEIQKRVASIIASR